MKVLLAENAGFCFGVKRAVDKAIETQKKYNKKIYTLGPLIHNSDVVNYLEENNIFSVSLDNISTLNHRDIIVIRSHGVSKETMNILQQKGLLIIDATCPFVTNIQKKVNKFSNEGYKIVIVGDKTHPEVVGINGWCNNDAIITKDGNFDIKLPDKVCVVSQTTEKEENWNNTINNISNEVNDLKEFNTICAATEERQKSVYNLSKKVDYMIVIGGKHSSNTTKLYEIAKKNCSNTIHIENVKELPEELLNNKSIKLIGITAGASTPDWIIKEVVKVMEGM